VTPAARRLAIAAAAIHLSIAAFFSTHWEVERFLPAVIDRPLKLYGQYTGAQTHFNFFAPTVSTQARARFVLTRPDGSEARDELVTGNSEANQRIAMMFTFYGVAELRPFLARAWAVHMLTRHPDADSVEVLVELLEIPTLAELKAGKASRWVEIDRTRLARRDLS
jgi:hypothetical protein